MTFHIIIVRKMASESNIPLVLKDTLVLSVQNQNEERFAVISAKIKESYAYDESQREIDDLFVKLVISNFMSPNPDMLKAIIAFYEQINPGDIPSPPTYLFMLPYRRYAGAEFTPILKYLVVEMNIDPVALLDEMILLDRGDSYAIIDKVFEIYPKRFWTRDILKPLVEKANERSTYTFEALFKFYVEISPYAPIPKWVRNFVYDPEENKVGEKWLKESKASVRYTPEVVEEARRKQLPFWMVDEEFVYEEQDSDSIYEMVKNQDTPLGFFVDADQDEFADYDEKGNQLPFFEDLGLPDYPNTKYTADKVLEALPEYWDDTWETIQRNVLQSGRDQELVLEMDPDMELAYLRNRVLGMNLLDLEMLFRPYLGEISMEDIMTDIFYFRVYGPKNAIPSDPFDPSGSFGEGGERMFLSNVFDYDEDENEEYNWFLGHCLNCALKIRRYQHAIRLPVKGGGFKGCYCSGECALKAAMAEDERDEITPRLLEEMVDNLYAIGIQDFTLAPEEEGEGEGEE